MDLKQNKTFWFLMAVFCAWFIPIYKRSNKNIKGNYHEYFLLDNLFSFHIGYMDKPFGFEDSSNTKIYFIKIPFFNKLLSFQLRPFGNIRFYDAEDYYKIIDAYDSFYNGSLLKDKKNTLGDEK